VSKFWYSPLNASMIASSSTAAIVLDDADLMFLLGALEPLTVPDNWEIDPEIDLGGLSEDEYKSALSSRYDGLISSIFDPPV
jgi:hypothetical protein